MPSVATNARHLEPGDQHAVDETDERAHQAAGDHHDPHCGVHDHAERVETHPLHQEAGDHTRQPKRGAYGQVDTTVEDDEKLPHGQ